jgi:hypothetical protein
VVDSEQVLSVLEERNRFIRVLLDLYEQRIPISVNMLIDRLHMNTDDLDLWLSIMQSENVLKAVPGQSELYSLFRTHHTVCLVAGDEPEQAEQ